MFVPEVVVMRSGAAVLLTNQTSVPLRAGRSQKLQTDALPARVLSDHHRAVRREAVLLHGAHHRPMAVVHLHRRRRAAVGTGERLESEGEEEDDVETFVARCCNVAISTIAMAASSAHERKHTTPL